MPTLKLGPLPDDKPIKVTVTLSAELAGLLGAYGAAVGSTDGKAPSLERLIPPIIERFIRSDRAFARQLRPRIAKAAPTSSSRAEEESSR